MKRRSFLSGLFAAPAAVVAGKTLADYDRDAAVMDLPPVAPRAVPAKMPKTMSTWQMATACCPVGGYATTAYSVYSPAGVELRHTRCDHCGVYSQTQFGVCDRCGAPL